MTHSLDQTRLDYPRDWIDSKRLYWNSWYMKNLWYWKLIDGFLYFYSHSLNKMSHIRWVVWVMWLMSHNKTWFGSSISIRIERMIGNTERESSIIWNHFSIFLFDRFINFRLRSSEKRIIQYQSLVSTVNENKSNVSTQPLQAFVNI